MLIRKRSRPGGFSQLPTVSHAHHVEVNVARAIPQMIAAIHPGVRHENLDSLEKLLGDRCQVEFYGLRPNVLLTSSIDGPLWESCITRRQRMTMPRAFAF